MLPFILLPWAALGLSLPFAKMLGVVDRTMARKRQGRKTGLGDLVGDVKHMQAAESAAYAQTARCLCGGDKAPDLLVKGLSLAMKGVTSYATPSPIDLCDEVRDHARHKPG